jgi:hypothetical protein
VDNIIEKLLSVRNSKVPKQVNLLEGEIKGLCHKCKEIFMQQPILLELEAPLKICGILSPIQETSTDSTPTCCDSSTTASTLPIPTIFSWGTTWTGGNFRYRPYAC